MIHQCQNLNITPQKLLNVFGRGTISPEGEEKQTKERK